MKGKKPKDKKVFTIEEGLRGSKVWMNPNSTFKGPRGNRAWDHRQLPPSAARFLELADVALGSVQSSPKKKKLTA